MAKCAPPGPGAHATRKRGLLLSKPFWDPILGSIGEFTTHVRTDFSGEWDVHWGDDLDFDPGPEQDQDSIFGIDRSSMKIRSFLPCHVTDVECFPVQWPHSRGYACSGPKMRPVRLEMLSWTASQASLREQMADNPFQSLMLCAVTV